METFFSQIATYLWTQSVQIAVLCVLVGAACFALRKRTSHLRYLLWLLIVAKCLAPSLATVSLAILPNEPETPRAAAVEPVMPILIEAPPAVLETRYVVSAPSTFVEPKPAEPSIFERLSEIGPKTWFGIIWLAGLGVFTVVVLVKAARIHHSLKSKRRPVDEALQNEVDEILTAAGKTPRFWLVGGTGQPFVWGLVRGSVYLPANFTRTTDRAHRKKILAHELAHVGRFDALVNVLQTIAQAIFWFHPLVWIANRSIRAEREKCCDETAIARLAASPKDYSTAIVDTLVNEYKSTLPTPSLAIAGPIKNIEDRIKTIMKPGKRFYKRPTVIAMAIICFLAAIVVPTTIALTQRTEKVDETSSESVDIPLSELPREVRAEIEKLWSTDTRKRANAVMSLRYMGMRGRADAAVPYLTDVLGDDSKFPEMVLMASSLSSLTRSCSSKYTFGSETAETIARIGKKSDRLLTLLESDDWKVRADATRAVGGLKDSRAVDTLIAFVRDKNEHPYVKGNAAIALGLLKDDRASEPLIAALKNDDPVVRKSAASALGRLGPPDATEALTELLDDKDHQVRMAAAGALGSIKESDVIPALLKALADEHRQVREVAAGALSRRPDPRSLQPLIEALGDSYPNTRARAAEALGELKDARVFEPLIGALKDKNEYVRWHAATALGDLKDSRVVEPLIAVATNDKHIARIRAINALGKLGGPRAKDTLNDILKDNNTVIKRNARDALRKLTRNYDRAVKDTDASWGSAVEGVQCRVRAGKPTWAQGTVPKLFADLRNQGNRNLRIALEHESWEIEIDGKWHETHTFRSGRRRYLPLEPGGQQQDLEVWIHPNDSISRNLRALEPGKHTLRVARLINYDTRPREDMLRVVSNPVVIEIVAAKDAEPDISAEKAEKAAVTSAQENAESLVGIILVAAVDMKNIDSYRSLGIQGGFGNGQPICDFKATAKYVSRYGNALSKGDRFVIGSAKVSKSTDGYGNTGTKLLLWSAAPKEGLAFYCYGYDRADKSYWAIGRQEIQQAIKGYFIIEGKDQTTELSGATEAEIAGRAEDAKAQIQVLEGLIAAIETLCVPAKGTLRHAVERRFGKGAAVNSANDLSEVDDPASRYRLYEFCQNGSLLVCYDSESLAEVEWARYIELYPMGNRSEPLTGEEKLPRLRLRQEQMQLIFAEYTKRFGEDKTAAWGEATDDVRVRLRDDRKSWPVGSDPSFQFDIGNQSNRTLSIAYPQLFKVEVDGQWHEANYFASGEPRSSGTGGQMTYRLSLGDFLSDGAERLSTGKHTVRAALFHIGARKFEAISNPVVIEVGPTVEEDATWSEAVKDVQMRLHVDKVQWPVNETSVFKVDVRNTGNIFKNLTLDIDYLRLKVDNRWFKPPSGPRGRAREGLFKVVSFTEGTLQELVLLESWGWTSVDSGEPLKFTPGKHKIRAGMKTWAIAEGDPEAFKLLGESGINDIITSNEIEIEILPTGYTEPDMAVEMDTDIVDFSGKPIQGVLVKAAIARKQWPIGGDMPRVDVEVRISDPKQFQESGLSTRAMDHDISAVALEIDGKQYKNHSEYLGEIWQGPLQSSFKLLLVLDDEWQGTENSNPPQLAPGLHTIRVLFVGLGMKPPPASNSIEIEVLSEEVKLEPWPYPWGMAVRGVQVSSHPAQPSWPVGSEPVIRIGLRNQGNETWSIHRRPSSFALEVDGKRYENNFIFHVWQRPFAPGDIYQFDLKLSKDRPWHDGLRQGNSWPPVGKSPPLPLGKHTIRVMFTELRIEPEPASLPVEFEIVGAKDAMPDMAAEEAEKAAMLSDVANEIEMASLEGITLVASVDMKRIDRYRSLGIRGGFGNGQPICDFIARANYVSKHGNSMQKGDRFVIGSAEVVNSTDTFGNSGTKLILRSAAPKEGLILFCYGYDRADRSFWAIDRGKIQQALKGYFTIEGKSRTSDKQPRELQQAWLNLHDHVSEGWQLYMDDNDGVTAGALSDLKPHIDKGVWPWTESNVVLVSKRQKFSEIEKPSEYPIAYDKSLLQEGRGTNVAFADGHVEFVKLEDIDAYLHIFSDMPISGRGRPFADRPDAEPDEHKAIVEIETRLLFADRDFPEEVWMGHGTVSANVLFLSKKESELKTEAIASSGPVDKPTSVKVPVKVAFVDDSQVKLLIKVTQAHKVSSMLTAPKLKVLEDEEAKLKVVEEIPFIAGYKEGHTVTTAGEPVAIHDRVEMGIILSVTPRITEDGKYCVLELETKLSKLSGYDRRRYLGKYSYDIPRMDVLELKCKGLYVPAGKTLLLFAPWNSADDKKGLIMLVKPTISEAKKNIPAALPPIGAPGFGGFGGGFRPPKRGD